MKCIARLKNLKVKSRKANIFLWFFAVLLLPLMLAAPPNVGSAHSRESRWEGVKSPNRTEVLLAHNCRRGETADPRGPLDPLIPYVISPRRSLLLSDKPKLRWNAVPGASRYTVSLVKGEKMIWETTASATEVVYPGEPPLEPGSDYLLVIKADNGRSSQEEELPARGFRLLPAAEAQVVKTAIAQLNNQQVTDKVKALQSAYLYIGSDLKSEAIETLEALIAGGTQEATIYRRLGDLYWRGGVTLLAESNYLEAVKKATDAKDVEEQAQISATLGDFYVAIGEEQEAIRWLTQARDSYKSLGNTQRIKELDRQIQELKSAL
ncbi:tetratricopeptide repeat protein [Trichocoleus sp. DQ-A3]|uniref:tetratricopeptide repeat protein n=1 Tax=Cyanophyceae TaxID=3028117 RepID=UPI00168846D2|nr:tetratricopeptide repeat protein [Coleofasciculus sp. FACHB-125]MBD1902070.1 tetratricopeptide repeat protein [Coleofasciculus sp. FACHB-125]